MNVLICQSDICWEKKAANFGRVRSMVEKSVSDARSRRLIRPEAAGAALIVLPEMFATGFSMNAAATAEEPGGETESFLRALAADTGCCVLGGLIVRQGGMPRNQALAISPQGEILVRYTKQRPFSPAKEDITYPAGGQSVVFDWGGFRIAPLICYDLRFPELFRAAAAQGATLFAVIANWPAPRQTQKTILLQARAIENQAFVLGVNRTGRDPFHEYAGQSIAIDPHGRILTQASAAEEYLLLELDPSAALEWRRDFPALRDAGLW